ncbi:MAG: hypothetical protein GXX96_32860 [Planctomycetaceae bacterium]|nr:hypothetical protein [Planctomycetaceae bacterium]
MSKTLTALCLCLHAVAALAAEPGPVSLKSSRTTIEFDRARAGAVVSLTDNSTHTEFINKDAAQDLFAIAWTRPGDTSGKQERLTGHDAKNVHWEVTERSVTAVFERLGGHDLTVTCLVSADPARDDVRWQLHASGEAPLVLERIDFPILDLRAPLEADGASDTVVTGLTKGGVFHQPAKWKTGQGLSFPQPGSLAAQFGCYYSARAGLVSHTCDSRGFPKTLDLHRTADGLRWMWQRRCYHPMKQPFELGYEISTATFTSQTPGEPADWRDGADLYKQWALQQPWCAVPFAQRTDVPDWMKSGPAMIRFSRDWLGRPERVEGWLDDYWKKHFPKTPLIVALWGWERVGSWVSPKYFPPYPSEEGFKRVVAAARKADGHAFPWPSGYYWNVEYQQNPDGTFQWNDWDDFNATGLPHALIERDGTPLVRKLPWLEGGRNAVLCRGDAWTRQWFNRNAVTLMQLGCDMVQVDQVVGGLAPGGGECYSTQHCHPPGLGVWDAEAFADQLRSLAAECRGVQPDAVLSIEEPQELFNHLIGVQDYRDGQSQRWPSLPETTHASVFGYLYHEYLPVFQSNPVSGDLKMLAYCAVTGQIPHWVPHWPVSPSPALVGGDFEEWSEEEPAGWQRVSGWQGTNYVGLPYRDDSVKSHGTASMRLENRLESDIVQVSQNVSVGPGHLEPGHTYRLRARMKVESLAKPNAVNLAALTSKLGSKGSWRIPLPGPGDWSEGSVEFTMPDEATFLRIMIHVSGTCRLWIDDVVLEERVDDRWEPLIQPGSPPEHEFVEQWVRLFHGEGRPYLLLGTMIHPPRLLAPLPPAGERPPMDPVMTGAFRAPDGSEAAVVANATAEPQEVQLQWQGRVHNLQMAPSSLRLVR